MAVVADVDPAGADIRNFQHVRTQELVLDVQIVLPDQRRVNVVVVRRVEIGTRHDGGIEVEPPRQ